MLNEYLPINPSWQNCFFCVLIYMFMAILTMNKKKPYYNQRTKTHLGWFLIFVFFMFSFCYDDWFSYFGHIKLAKYNIGSLNNLSGRDAMEPIYYYMAFALNGDYLLWRLVVFGSVLLLSYHTGKRLGLNKMAFVYAYSIIAVPILSYARVSLAMAIAFYGLSLLTKPIHSQKTMSSVIGLFALFISVFFHKSALALPVFALIAYTFRITRMKLFMVVLLLFGFIVFLNSTNFLSLFLGMEDVQSLVSEKSSDYLYYEIHLGGIGQFTIKMMSWGSYYLFAVLSLSVLLKEKNVNKCILPYVNAVLIIVLFASVFLFVRNVNTFTLFYRFLNFASIPIAITVAYCINVGINRKAFVNVTLLCLLTNILSMLYSTYSAYVHY